MVALVGLCAGLAGPLTAQQGEMPPTPVSVLTVETEELPVINELPGRISATRLSDVRPRVSGIIEERVFEQGSLVKEGDVLYRIDPKPFAVRVRSAEASLARAQATLSSAEVELRRQKELSERKVSAAVELERAETTVLQAEADVAIAEATLAEAQLNLDYTEVRAPISGVIGRALVTEGALVSENSTQHLAVIQQLDPVYADVTQSSSELFRLRAALEAGQLSATAPGEATAQLIFDDGTPYEHRGKLLFSEATVDETTGQVTLRGEFANPDNMLLPGLYVRVRIEQAIDRNAIAIPQTAVLRDARGNAQVYVLKEDNKVDLRPVEMGATLGSRWLVRSGLKAGDTVVIEGAQKLYPGATVAPEQVKAEDLAAADAPADDADAAPDADAAAGQAPGQAAEDAAPAAADDAAADGDTAQATEANDAGPDAEADGNPPESGATPDDTDAGN